MKGTTPDSARYREVQAKKPWWIWAVTLGSCGVTTGVLGAILVAQMSSGQPIGDRPLSTSALALIFACVVVFDVLLVGLIALWRLDIEVRERVLWVRMRPFTTQEIPFSKIASVEARTYRPIAEYGGWGMRGLGKNRALNMSGNEGVQLVLEGGDRLLLGSQRHRELAAAIEAQRSRSVSAQR